jgi:hypothetical protein
MAKRKSKTLPSGFKEGTYGINKTCTFGENDVTLRMESELDDIDFYQSFSGYFGQLENEWRNMLESIAVLCQKKLQKIG